MRIGLLKQTLSALIDVNRPCLVEGSPGLGKTQLFGQLCEDKGIGFLHKHAPTMQPEDLGLPSTNADKSAINFLVDEKFPIVGRPGPERGVILIDELPQGDMSIQKTCANMFQEREIHGHKLKPGWVCMATGNKQSDRAGANRILSHLGNRVTRLTVDANLDDWCDWALHNNVRPEVVGFLRFKPNMLMDFDPNRESNPTPRAWVEGVSAVIDKVPPEAELDAFAGAVSEGAAAEFVGFLRLARELPNPDLVLAQADTYPIPDAANVRYALAGSIAYRATPENFDKVVAFARRLPPEFMILLMRDAVRLKSAVVSTKAFIDWTTKEGVNILA